MALLLVVCQTGVISTGKTGRFTLAGRQTPLPIPELKPKPPNGQCHFPFPPPPDFFPPAPPPSFLRCFIRSTLFTCRHLGAALLLLAAIPAPAQDIPPSASPSSADTNANFYPNRPDLNPAPTNSLSLHNEEPPAPETAPLNLPETINPPSGLHFVYPEGQPDDLPAHLLVVYNSSDPSSQALAAYYAERRAIASDHVLGIPCSRDEEISRADYEKTLREPIISYIYGHAWMTRRSVPVRLAGRPIDLLIATRNDIWAIVLMRGVPLKIANDPTITASMQGDGALQTNAAAVDSELALLPVFGLPLGGFIPNALFDGSAGGIVRAGPELSTKLILVTRLDGPTPADVRRMIDDSIYAEQNRLAGLAVIDTRGLEDVKNPYTLGDVWLRNACTLLGQDGWSVRLDTNPDVLPPSDPLNQVALYLGWYHDGATGPLITPPDRFVRGAIAYHLHSFSAASVRDPHRGWVGPLIAHGAAATMGTVYEPYLDLTPHLQIFTRRLLADNYFAEAAYAAQPGLSWMTTVVGDPLYRPFHQSLTNALADTSASTDPDHHDWLLLQQVQGNIASGQLPLTLDNLERYLGNTGPVGQEGLGDLLGKIHDPDAALAAQGAYRNAASLATAPIDRIRVGLKLAQAYANNGQGDLAQSELKTLRELYPADASRFGVSSALVPTSTPQPPGPPAPPSP